MNLLAVDIGNTDIKFALFDGDMMQRHWRAQGEQAMPENFGAFLRQALADAGVGLQAAVYATVVPAAEATLRDTLLAACQLTEAAILAVDATSIRLPIDLQVYPPNQLGTDRLVDACSARLLYPEHNVVVADFGTATTLDLVNRYGQYLGGAIAPGLHTFSRSLQQNTARLPEVSMEGLSPSDLSMGQNTIACIQAGLGIGYRGLVRELLSEAGKAFHGEPVLYIATGGLAQTVLALCDLENAFDRVDSMLTLYGLAGIYRFNMGSHAF